MTNGHGPHKPIPPTEDKDTKAAEESTEKPAAEQA